MNHIKLFNEAQGFYFSEININEWDELFYTSLESFKPSEFRFIKTIIFPDGTKKGEQIEVAFSNQRIKCISEKYDLTIFKFMDELYGVLISSDKNKIRYKCDTFDGVRQCLKHFKENETNPSLWKKVSESTNNYYTKITLGKYRDLNQSGIEYFEDKIVDDVRTFALENGFDFDMPSNMIRIAKKPITSKSPTIFIRPIKDEYFLVSYYCKSHDDIYLCDQLERLMICLNDLA